MGRSLTDLHNPEPDEPALDDDMVFHVPPCVEISNHVDSITVKNAENGSYFSLQGTGLVIWETLNEQQNLAEVKKIVADKYRLAKSECAASIDAFVGELMGEGLLEAKLERGEE